MSDRSREEVLPGFDVLQGYPAAQDCRSSGMHGHSISIHEHEFDRGVFVRTVGGISFSKY